MQTVTQADVDAANAKAVAEWEKYESSKDIQTLRAEYAALEKRKKEINDCENNLARPWLKARNFADYLQYQLDQQNETQKEQNQ